MAEKECKPSTQEYMTLKLTNEATYAPSDSGRNLHKKTICSLLLYEIKNEYNVKRNGSTVLVGRAQSQFLACKSYYTISEISICHACFAEGMKSKEKMLLHGSIK